MNITKLISLVLFLKMISSNISKTNSQPNGNNYTFQENNTALNFSLGDNNFTIQDFNENSTASYETIVEQIASILDVYVTPFLIVFGVTGNTMSLYVFFTSKLRYHSTSQYLSALAASDLLFLGELVPPWLSTMGISGVFHQERYCKGFVYLSYVSCSLSSWLVVAFTIERFVAVQYPLQCPSICTVKRARYIILGLTVGAMVLNLPVIHFAGSENQTCHIDREKLEQAAKFNWMDTTLTFTVPLILIIFFNTWIATAVYRMDRDRVNLTHEELLAASIGQYKPRDTDFVYTGSQRRITNMLLFVSTMFVVLNFPAYTLRVCGYAYDLDSKELDDKWLTAQNIATTLFNTNFGINFFLYCLSGQNFRHALAESVPCCRWIARKKPSRSTGNRARTCSFTTSAASLGTDATCQELTSVRPNTRGLRRRSRNYIMRWTFDNSRQRRSTAVTNASESIGMHEIVSRPGPSRVLDDDHSRPGPSRVLNDNQSRPGPSRVLNDNQSRPGPSRVLNDNQSRPGTSSGMPFQQSRAVVELRRPVVQTIRPVIESRRSAPLRIIRVEKRRSPCV